jgi:hypothetical protein
MEKYRGYIGGFWLGFSLSAFCNINLFDIEWWLVVVPTIILFVTSNNKNT